MNLDRENREKRENRWRKGVLDEEVEKEAKKEVLTMGT